MAENSKIEWTDHTFNPWVGCTKVSPACDHCYAEGWAKRTGQAGLWAGERRRTTAANWKQPIKWDRQAAADGVRARVFCASLADVFDNQADLVWRIELFQLIERTPNLDWLLLTKRPQNIAKMLPLDWGDGWPNVWLGTTVENQQEANRRIPHLLGVPARVHFLSCEPLLGPLDLKGWVHAGWDGDIRRARPARHIKWVIAGGESGPGARPAHPDWFRSLRDQCRAGAAAFHFKQWGEWAEDEGPPAVGRDTIFEGTTKAAVLVDGAWQHFPNGFCGPVELCERPGDWLFRIGKKRAGRLLDGVQHDGLPA